jgi:2-oxoisovalerate dehydrogenase E2 component (dihydrolipoyl transacylase)
MKSFKLPDLGEGLQEAEIVNWHVSEGDEVVTDQPLLSVETAKAIVDIPSPFTGRVLKLHGKAGDVIPTGNDLVGYEDAGGQREDKATVVGQMTSSNEVVKDTAAAVGGQPAGMKATPAVRALAHRLNVDLSIVTPSGPDGLITANDVQRVHRILSEVEPLEPLRGVRRAMAANMARAHAEVVAVTLMDVADVDEWPQGTDVTVRLIRAVVAGFKAEPALNAWYDSHEVGRRLLKKVHLGMAADTPDGLFVPVLFDADSKSPDELRAEINRLKEGVKARNLPPEQLRGHTITLSNFGTIAGRYADPVVMPPTVAILGAGRMRKDVVAVGDEPKVHRIIPLSLTFDHRSVTGGEAGRFLAAVMQDLAKAD